MLFSGFKVYAKPFIGDSPCKNRGCNSYLVQVSNGLLSSAMFCKKCKNVYVLKLVKVPDSEVTEEFLIQAEKETDK